MGKLKVTVIKLPKNWKRKKFAPTRNWKLCVIALKVEFFTSKKFKRKWIHVGNATNKFLHIFTLSTHVWGKAKSDKNLRTYTYMYKQCIPRKWAFMLDRVFSICSSCSIWWIIINKIRDTLETILQEKKKYVHKIMSLYVCEQHKLHYFILFFLFQNQSIFYHFVQELQCGMQWKRNAF